MRKIFAAIRRMLADMRSQEALGAVVRDAITRFIVPDLKKESRAVKNPSLREKYEELIAEYTLHADPRNSGSREFDEIARRVMMNFAQKYGRDETIADEVAQDIASSFYADREGNASSWMGSFRSPRFDAKKGISALKRHWSTILSNQAAYAFREKSRKEGWTKRVDPIVDEEGESDPFRTIPAPSPETDVDARVLNEILGDLEQYIRHNSTSFGFRGKLVPKVFRMWMSAVNKKGADSVSMENDVYKALKRDMGSDAPARTTVSDAWLITKKLIAQFYEKELGVRLSDAMRKKLHVSSEIALTYETFRRRLAQWVLCR